MTPDLAGVARRALDESGLERLRRARSAVYWADLLASASVGWGLLVLAAGLEGVGALRLLATLGAVLAQLRALVFVHEIAHRRTPSRFEAAWNLGVGVPMCVPSPMYVGSHLEHHRADRFASADDPEYAPIATWSLARRALFVCGGAWVPLLLVLRWGLLGPLSLGPLRRLRPFVVGKCSTLSINPAYTRDEASYRAAGRVLALEWACAGFVWTSAGVLAAGALPVAFAVQWFVVVGGVFTLNQLRTLAAHGYASFGARLDRDGQFLDSINLTASPLTLLVAPLGLRYHALHHLLPELPYHSLGSAHRALSRCLAQGSLYQRCGERSLAEALRALSRAT